MDSKDNLKRYQKEKFENYKRVNELNINDNEAYITLRVNNINDIISKYSVHGREMLSKEFIDTLTQQAAYISIDYPLVLEIVNDKLNAEEKILIRKLIKNYYTLVTINKETELKAIKRKSNFFLIFGIIFFTILTIFLNLDIQTGFDEIISFISSFSIWEWAELVIFEQDNLTEEILMNKHISKIRVVFGKDNG